MEDVILAIWAATMPLSLYALYRKNNDALAVLVLLFFILLIDVFIGLNRPNPDHVIFIRVTE